MPDKPSRVSYGSEGRETYQEVAIIDVWVDFGSFFGKTKGPYDDEKILVSIEKALRKVQPVGPRLRIFDKTSRQLRVARTDRICQMVLKRRLDTELARHILARLGDKQIVSPIISDAEIFGQVRTGMEAVNRWKDSGKGPVILTRKIDSSTGRGVSYTFLAVAHSSRRNVVSALTNAMAPFGLESSSVVDGDDYTLLLFRLSHQGSSLTDPEVRELKTRIDEHIEDG